MTVEQSTASVWPVLPRPGRSALLALPFQVGFLVVAVIASASGVPHVQIGLALLLAPTLWAPTLAELVLRTHLPFALQLHYLIFMTAGPYAGSVLNVYGYIPYWDKLVHFDSGVMLAWLGMLLVRRMEEQTGMTQAPRWFALVVMQLTTMAFAAAWEICEYASDVVIGTRAQLNNADTMGDIIAGTLGGLLAIVIVLLWRQPASCAPAALQPTPRPAKT